jgi:hypothetical protein
VEVAETAHTVSKLAPKRGVQGVVVGTGLAPVARTTAKAATSLHVVHTLQGEEGTCCVVSGKVQR